MRAVPQPAVPGDERSDAMKPHIPKTEAVFRTLFIPWRW